ncbi:MAG: hypothetical protein RL653_3393 [Pseudomonadota bacterium]|jgi:diguanylate cyclase (GGDEF)-like protein
MSPLRSTLARKLLFGVGLPGLILAAGGLFGLWQMAESLAGPEHSEHLTQLFRGALATLGIFWGVMLLATVGAIHYLLVRPMARLAAVMKRAEDGDLVVRADDSRKDEIGQLSHAFNRMLVRLTEMKVEEIDTHWELERAQKELSLKAQLEDANGQLSRRVGELSLLYDVSRALNETLEVQDLLGRITSLVAERLGVPRTSLMLVNAEGRLELRAAWPKQSLVGLTFAPGEGACGRAAAERKSVYVPDLSARDGVYVKRGVAGEATSGSMLAVPLVHKDTVLGVLNLERPAVDGFRPEEHELLQSVADQAAVAVQNARLHAQTVALSITDPLTGAPNRRHLFQRMEIEVARAHRFGTQLSVLMVDIDHFKQLNDQNGHRAGDEVLQRVAGLLGSNLRKVDLLARYGGEEFMVLLPQVPKEEATGVAEKLRRLVSETPDEYGPGQPLGRVTISVGVANLPVDATDQDKLVDCADSALYAAKRAGRDKAIGYAAGMELHPGRQRGPNAERRKAQEPTQGEGNLPVRAAEG